MAKCFRRRRRRKNHLPGTYLEDKWTRARWYVDKIADTGGKKADPVFYVAHRQTPAELAPGPEFRWFEHLCDTGRGAQEFNAGAERYSGDGRARFQRGASLLKRQMTNLAQQTGNRAPLSRTLDRTQPFIEVFAERFVWIVVLDFVRHFRSLSSRSREYFSVSLDRR